jgi:hypothetical protein
MGAEYMTRAISSTTEAALRHGPDRALAFGRHLLYLCNYSGQNLAGATGWNISLDLSASP